MAASSGGRLWRRLWRRPPAVAGAVVVLFFIVLAVGAPWIATSDPQRSDYGKIRKAPTAANPFGTDDLGRDTFSRVVWGTRISMQAGVFSILLAIAIGVPHTTREKVSRPRSSVPNGLAAVGAFRILP